MRLQQTLWLLFTLITAIHALTLPDPSHLLFRRKGGGGGGGARGGGGVSSGGGSSGGSSGGRGGTTGGGGETGGTGSTGGRGGTTGGTGSTGGTSGGTSGVRPSYGGGGGRAPVYSGGAATPYKAGGLSPSGVRPFVYGAGAAALLFPGLWLYSTYAYHYDHPYTYTNETTNMNDTRPVTCLCEEYQQCGCDSNNQTDYINSVANNATLAHVADVNGTSTLIINGTLPNDTDSSTSSTGTTGTATPDTGAGHKFKAALGWCSIAFVTTCLLVIA